MTVVFLYGRVLGESLRKQFPESYVCEGLIRHKPPWTPPSNPPCPPLLEDRFGIEAPHKAMFITCEGDSHPENLRERRTFQGITYEIRDITKNKVISESSFLSNNFVSEGMSCESTLASLILEP